MMAGRSAGLALGLMGTLVVVAGCAPRPTPVALAPVAALPASVDSTGTVPTARTASMVVPAASEGGDLADEGGQAPRPDRLVAVRGGNILVETPAEQAEARRQRAAMLKSVEGPRVDFHPTGTLPVQPTP